VTGALAKQAAERVVGQRVDALQTLSAGQTSKAWLATLGSDKWVVRVPIGGSDRRITYQVESLIDRYLGLRRHQVAVSTPVEVAGVPCSVARYLQGVPVTYGENWCDEFGRAFAKLLEDLHAMPAQGHGPLVNRGDTAIGLSTSRRQAIVDRWCHARIWPFDDSSLGEHPIMQVDPRIGEIAGGLVREIERAQSGSTGVIHSDLHREHLLLGDDDSLAGVLDFGDAFVGATAWDFALINWYYGEKNAELVAGAYRNGEQELEQGRFLAVVVGLYKMDKNPADRAVLPRLRRCIEAVRKLG